MKRVALALTAVVLTGVALTGVAAQAAPPAVACPVLADPAGDERYLPGSLQALDVTGADVVADSGSVTAVLHVRGLGPSAQPPAQSLRQYVVSFDVSGVADRLFLGTQSGMSFSVPPQVEAWSFYGGRVDFDEDATDQQPPLNGTGYGRDGFAVTGRVDVSKGEIRITVSTDVLRTKKDPKIWSADVRVGSTISGVRVNTWLPGGLVVNNAGSPTWIDRAAGTQTYVVGSRSCGARRR